jgi:hypothetical protein
MEHPSESSLHPRFFIVGCPRSGTTLLQAILSAHPAVCIPPETWFFSAPRSGEHDRPLSDDEIDRLDRVIGDHCKLHHAEVDFDELRRALGATDRRPIHVLDLALRQFAERHGATICGEKTPHHLWSIDRIRIDLPEARFLVMVRDPRAVVASLQRVPWNLDPPRRAVWRWIKDARETVRQVEALPPETIRIVRYEDLVERTEETVRSTCDFLGLAWHEAMAAHERTDQSGIFPASEDGWKSNARRAVSSASLARWSEELDPDDAEFIRIVTRSWRRRLGYDVEPHGPLMNRVGAWASFGEQIVGRAARSLVRRVRPARDVMALGREMQHDEPNGSPN